MREIFFDEKLGETRRNSEGCKPHGQGWGASRTGREGVGAARAGMGVVGGMGAVGAVGVMRAVGAVGAVGGTRRNSEGLGEVGGTRRGE